MGWVGCEEKLDAKEKAIFGEMIELRGLILGVKNVSEELGVLVEFPDFHLSTEFDSMIQFHALVCIPYQERLCHK